MPRTVRVRRYPIPTRQHPPRELIPIPVPRRPWRRTPGVVLGFVVLASVAVLATAAPQIDACRPLRMDMSARLAPPSLDHWLGTDQFGRDVCCRTLYGGRISLLVGLMAVTTAVVPGLCLGLVAGYYGGWVDSIVSRSVDIALAFPGILLALLVMAWLGPSLTNAMVAIGLSGIPRYVRLSRSSTMQLKRTWFVRAAQIVGCTNTRVLTHHVLPNVLPSVIALATVDVAWAILSATTLSFLGLGARPPTPEWGAMINEGRGFLRQAPWVSLAPATTMTITVLAINLLGDGLRSALDPRAR